jgi:tetratricopeptide (TPR) repeat protein
VEAAVVARDYRGALQAIREFLAAEGGGRSRSHPALFDSLQAIAHLGLGDTASARIFLNSFLGQVNLRVDNLLAVASRLTALEAGPQAWQTLARAVEIDPRNQAALARLIELDLALNRIDALPAHVQQFVGMRRPSPDILRVVQQRLGSDLFLFSGEAPAALEAVRQALEAGEKRPRRP